LSFEYLQATTYYHVNHGYSNEFLDSDRIANVYFTSDVDAKNRIRSLNEFFKINLNAIRRAGMHDDGVFNDCQLSDKSLMMKMPLMIAKQM
jgi:hypothetical protein